MAVGKDATRLTDLKVDKFEAGEQINTTGTITTATIGTATITTLNGKTAKKILVIANLSADKTLSAAEKLSEIIEVTVSDATKTLTLGMAAGERMIVKNNDATNALVVKNIAGDDALTIPASGSAIVFAGTGGSMIYFMDTTA